MNKLGWRIVLTILVVLAVAGAFVAGVFLDQTERPAIERVFGLANKETAKPATVDFAPFWKAWKIIDERFVAASSAASGSAAVTDQTKVWGAIDGLVSSLGDPYSIFLPPSEKKTFDEDISGNFGGIGIEIGIRDRLLTVIAPLPETPASVAGIKSGDRIIEINGQATVKMGVDEAVRLIRGEIGTKVKLKVIRGEKNEPLDFTLIRATIKVPTLETKTLPSGVFYIRLYNFGATEPDLFRRALRQFVEAGTDKLIIDLRGNPGGYLEAAIESASWFLPAGRPVVIEDHGASGGQKIYRSRGYNVFTDQLKLAILVDGGSASAAEIMAGALAEYSRATLVGEKTFGKGSVQELIPLTDDTAVKLTIARWLTPKGLSISHEGLMPDVTVTVPDREKLKAGEDPQLDRAIRILLSKKT